MEFTDDLIIEILVRAPIKLLGRCSLLSNNWNVILKSDTVMSKHHKLSRESKLLMCSHDDETQGRVFSTYSNDKSTTKLSPTFPILHAPNTSVAVVPNSCNGLVCYYEREPKPLENWRENRAIFVSNPATKNCRRLPLSSSQQETEHKFIKVGVAFGFDSTNIYDFKVLGIFSPHTNTRGGSYRPEMFTLSSNTWKQLHWGLDDSLFICRDNGGVFCANSFHFLALRRGDFPDNHNIRCSDQIIVCCDIGTEMFKTMELPKAEEDQRGTFLSLGVLKGFLSAIHRPYLRSSLDVWVKDLEESWTKLYKVGDVRPWGHHLPLCFWIEDDALLLTKGGAIDQLVSWNFNTSSGAEDVTIDGYDETSAEFVVYQETLAPVE